MKQRVFQQSQKLRLDEAPLWLQEVMRQLGATTWERHGSDVIVNAVRFGPDMQNRLEIHQGNPEAITELIQENRRSSAPAPRKSALKRNPWDKTIRR